MASHVDGVLVRWATRTPGPRVTKGPATRHRFGRLRLPGARRGCAEDAAPGARKEKKGAGTGNEEEEGVPALIRPAEGHHTTITTATTTASQRAERRGAGAVVESQRDECSCSYGPSRGGPDAYDDDPRFGVFSGCNDEATRVQVFGLGPPGAGDAARRTRLTSAAIPALREAWSPKCCSGATGGAVLRFAEELSARSAVDAKELFESTEFWHRTRRRIRRPVLVDMACGCGLTGVLFAVAERTVHRVVLVDRTETNSMRRVLEAAEVVAPWALPKIAFVKADIAPGTLREVLERFTSAGDNTPAPPATAADSLPTDDASSSSTSSSELRASSSECAGVLAVHACGFLTDVILEEAVSCGAAVAAMPCCYTGTARGTPVGVRRALGVGVTADVMRSFRLQDAGYHVDWAAIPRAVTPLNRVIVAHPPRGNTKKKQKTRNKREKNAPSARA